MSLYFINFIKYTGSLYREYTVTKNIWFLVLILTTGCRPSLEDGAYQGFVKEGFSAEEKIYPIVLKAKKIDRQSFRLDWNATEGSPLSKVIGKWSKKGHLKVKIPEYSSNSIYLKPVELRSSSLGWKCFKSSSSVSLGLCLDQVRLVFWLEEGSVTFKLSAELFPESPPILLEKPRKFDLTEAIQRALSSGFQSRLDYEHRLQAWKKSQQAILNLFPQANIRTIFTIAALNPFTLPGYIGDFAPFLLPTRWLNAQALKAENQSEALSLSCMRAEIATQVEALAFLLEKHESHLSFLKFLIDESEKVKARIEHHPQKTEIDQLLSTFIKMIKVKELKLDTLLHAHRRGIAQVLGMNNPEAIMQIDIPQLTEDSFSEQGHEIDRERVASEAVTRALELRQLDFLIEAARKQKKALYFSWSDPEVGAHKSISFGIKKEIAVSQSHIDELMILREKMQFIVREKAQNAVAQYSTSLQTYTLNSDLYQSQIAKFHGLLKTLQDSNRTWDMILLGLHFWDVATVLTGIKLELEDSILSWRLSRSLMDRMLLKGYYYQLLPEFLDHSFDINNI